MENTIIKTIIEPVLVFVIVIAVMFVAQRIADIVINRYFDRLHKIAVEKGYAINSKRYKTLAEALRRIVSLIIWISAIIFVLSHYGVNVAFLLSSAGAVGIFFGIAGKDILMDYYTGAMVLIEDQYRVGDVIWIDADHTGTVEEITLRTVILRDLQGNIHIVPHSLAPAIVNKTYDYSKINAEIGVAYDSDMELVKNVVNEVGLDLANDEDWKANILEPIAYKRIIRFDSSQITARAMGKVKAGEQWSIEGEFNRRLKVAFDKNGIEIPFPQQVVTYKDGEKPKQIAKGIKSNKS